MSTEWYTNGFCRCCHVTGEVRSLGATYSFDDTNEIYSVLLRETFNIIISPTMQEESASTYCICLKCVASLRDAWKFRKQVLDCEEKFSEYCSQSYNFGLPPFATEKTELKKDQESENEASPQEEHSDGNEDFDDEPLSVLACKMKPVADDEILGVEAKTDQPETIAKLSCEICEKKFKYTGSLELHMRVHSGEKMYRCIICETQYVLNKDLTKHISQTHCVNGTYPCKFCEEKFKTAAKLRTHFSIHYKQRFKCIYCEKDFLRKKGLKEHLKVHSGDRKFGCHLCNKAYGHRQSLKTHLLSHTGERPHICDVCGRGFPQRTHLQRHIYITHKGVKPYACTVCKKKFTSKSYLSIHARLHTGEKPFFCEICKKDFAAYTTLKVHMRVHTGFKPYTCNFCSRTFAQMGSFRQHERTHTGAKPYSCEVCKKHFSDSSYLKIHMRIHTNEKPFECGICQKSFREKGHLTRHSRVHTGIKPYSCKICKKQIGNLSKHMKVHTFTSDDKPFSCNVCHKSFSANDNLKLHIRLQCRPANE